jgi:hypothetical protein
MVLFFNGFLLPSDLSATLSTIVSKTWFPNNHELEKGLVESSFSQKGESGFISRGVTIGK